MEWTKRSNIHKGLHTRILSLNLHTQISSIIIFVYRFLFSHNSRLRGGKKCVGQLQFLMDDAHEAELRRIIENRRKRGSLKSSTFDLLSDPSSQPPRRAEHVDTGSSTTGRGSPPRSVAIQSNRTHEPRSGFLHHEASQQQSTQITSNAASSYSLGQRPPGPSILPRQASVPSRVSFLNPGAAEEKRLRESQALQEKKVDQLQEELRSGLTEIRHALNTVIQEQRPPAPPVPLSYAEPQGRAEGHSRNVKLQSSYFTNSTTTTTTTVDGPSEQPRGLKGGSSQQHLVDTPRAGGKGSYRTEAEPLTRGGLATHPSNFVNGSATTPGRFKSGQEFHLKNTVPVLDTSVIPGQSLGPAMDSSSRYQQELRRQSSAAHMQPRNASLFQQQTSSDAQRQHHQSITSPHHVSQSKPFQPPINIRPFCKTTIDLQSSLTILSEGEWFYKWDHTGEKVKLRWVWMDHSRRALSWSDKQLRETPMFGPRIPMEEIQRVMTTQITETDPHGNPRIFYVLLIECASRLLQLGTERRDKLDLWYEALTNLVQGTRQAMNSRVAASMGSD
jgi:hypothetical protein